MIRIAKIAMSMLVLGCLTMSAAEPLKIKLWPNGAPSKNGLEGTEERWEGAKVYEVSESELWVYKAEKPNGMAVVACPGGAYEYLSTDNEGTMFIDWMNERGITFAILKYRLPNGHSEVPLEDARRAMEIMRTQGKEFGVNPDEIGIMGSSAGGHLAATLSTMHGSPMYRPDFQILLYPVITMTDKTHKGSRTNLLGENPTADQIERYSLENRVSEQTPPAFIILAADDNIVDPINSLRYTEKLQAHKVPYSLHIYPGGGHGFGFRDTYTYKPQWSAELDRWLKSLQK